MSKKDLKDKFLYAASKPNKTGDIKLDATHVLHYEEFGNPKGKPIVYLHGGPGGGSGDHFHRYFDPEAFRIIIYDQRGAGKSTPAAEIKDNTPDILVEDIETLRKKLGIDTWHVYGGSWGSTLALLYAQAHPDKTESLTLRGIFLMRKRDIEMFYEAAELFRPEEVRKLKEALPEAERGADFMENFYKRLTSGDTAVSYPAARAWAHFEHVCCFLQPQPEGAKLSPEAQAKQDQDDLNISRIEAHFFRNCLFTPDDRILKDIDKIRHIPTVIVQGMYDIVCPPQIADDLHKAFPEAHMIKTVSGHAAIEPEIMKALVKSTDLIRDTGSPVPKQKTAKAQKAAPKNGSGGA